jgi:flagellar protein FliO/FliZ
MPGQAGSLVRVTVALIVVLAAVFAAAWFSRRMHGVGTSRSAALEVIAQLPLGPRERAVLVRVGAQQVLLGVASGNVRALHVLPANAAALSASDEAVGTSASTETGVAGPAAQRPTFKSMLLKSLGK